MNPYYSPWPTESNETSQACWPTFLKGYVFICSKWMCFCTKISKQNREGGKGHLFSFSSLLRETLHTICHFAEGGNSNILQKPGNLEVIPPQIKPKLHCSWSVSFHLQLTMGTDPGAVTLGGKLSAGEEHKPIPQSQDPSGNPPESLHSFPRRPTIQSSIALRFLFNESSWEYVLSVGVKSLMLTSLV